MRFADPGVQLPPGQDLVADGAPAPPSAEGELVPRPEQGPGRDAEGGVAGRAELDQADRLLLLGDEQVPALHEQQALPAGVLVLRPVSAEVRLVAGHGELDGGLQAGQAGGEDDDAALPLLQDQHQPGAVARQALEAGRARAVNEGPQIVPGLLAEGGPVPERDREEVVLAVADAQQLAGAARLAHREGGELAQPEGRPGDDAQ